MKKILVSLALVVLLFLVTFLLWRQSDHALTATPSELEQIRRALGESAVGQMINLANDQSISIRIDEQIGDYLKVSISTNPGGYGAFLKKETSGYRVIFFSQEAPECTALDNEALPAEVIERLVIGGGGCYRVDGSYRE